MGLLGLLGSTGAAKVVKINIEPFVDSVVDGIVLLTYLLQ